MAATLKQNALSFIDTVVISVAGTAPAVSLTGTTATLMAAAGTAGPAALLIAAVPMFGITVAFLYLNQWRSDCGATYAWVGRAVSPELGFLAGWALIVSNALFLVVGAESLGESTLHVLRSPLEHSVAATTAVAAGWYVLVVIPLFLGIHLVARFQRLFMLIELGVVAAILLGALTRGLAHPAHVFHWSWYSPLSFPSVAALMNSLLAAAFYYWGWDIAANLTEETRDRNSAPGRGALYGMIAIFLLFLFGQTVFQICLSDKQANDNSAALLPLLGDLIAPHPWGDLAVIATVISAMATLETSILQASRTLYAMGRDRVIGDSFGVIDERRHIPIRATLVVSIAGLAFFVISAFSKSIHELFHNLINAIGLQVVFYYSLAGLACFLLYRKTLSQSASTLILRGVWPLLSALALIVVGVYNVATLDWRIALPSLGSIALGLIPLAIYRRQNRAAFYSAGRETAILESGRIVYPEAEPNSSPPAS